MRQYQRQAIATASPEQLVAKLYDLGVAACHRGDRPKLRAVLVQLIGSINMEADPAFTGPLHALYDFCLRTSLDGDLAPVGEILDGLRQAWREGVLLNQAA